MLEINVLKTIDVERIHLYSIGTVKVKVTIVCLQIEIGPLYVVVVIIIP